MTKIENQNIKVLEIFFLLSIFFISFQISIRNIFLALLLIVYIFYKVKYRDFAVYDSEFNKYVILFVSFSLLSFFKAENIELAVDMFISPIFRYLVFYFIALELLDVNKYKKYIYIIFSSHLIIIIYGLYTDYFTNDDFFNRANSRGTFASLAVILSLSLLFNYKTKLIEKAFLICSVFLGLIAVSTYSRGAILGFITAMFLWTILMILKDFSYKKAIAFILILVILLVPIFTSDYIIGRFSHIQDISSDTSITTRLNMWNVSLQLIKENPILGIGIGNFSTTVHSLGANILGDDIWSQGHLHPHNVFIQIALGQGIISLILFLIMVFKAYKIAFINYYNFRKDSTAYFFAITFIAMLTSLLTHSFFDFPVKRSFNGILLIIFFIINYKFYLPLKKYS